jgi:ABC-type nitrate/sulfonate/bicarbonate transport system substrate-binding protein
MLWMSASLISAATNMASAQPTESKIIRAGHIPLTASLPVYAAKDNQGFDNEGLAVELINYGSSNEVAEAGVSGQVDVVGAAAKNAMLDAATASKKTVQALLLTQYVKRAGLQSADFLVAQPDITKLSDLKGREVAFFPGSVSKVLAKLTLPRYGLTLDDITLVEMPPAKWGAALANKEVDAAHLLEPAASKILADGKYTVLIDGYWAEVQEKVPVAAAWFVNGSLTADQEAKFYRALACGLKTIETKPDLARRALTKYTGVDESLAPKIRLLEYAMSSDSDAVKFARSLVAPLQTNNATMYQGSIDSLFYRPQ